LQPARTLRGKVLAQKLGILGGTFNPIHFGHLAAAELVRDRLKLDRVLFIPSYLPPHKRDIDIPSALHRQTMVNLAIAGNPHFILSDIEIKREGRSYSIDTMEELERDYPETEFYFIAGIDSFLEIQTWKDWQRLLSLCWFVVLSRPGYAFSDLTVIGFMRQSEKELRALDRGELFSAMVRTDEIGVFLEQIPLLDVSSTDIRTRVHQRGSIKYLLPEIVETYIINNDLYA